MRNWLSLSLWHGFFFFWMWDSTLHVVSLYDQPSLLLIVEGRFGNHALAGASEGRCWNQLFFSNTSCALNHYCLSKIDKIWCKLCLLQAKGTNTECTVSSGPEPHDFTRVMFLTSIEFSFKAQKSSVDIILCWEIAFRQKKFHRLLHT